MKTDPEIFQRASALFDELVDRDAAARAERIAAVARVDPEVARMAAELLAADAGASDAFESVIARGAAAALASFDDGAGYGKGERIGAWKIVSELGRGGMGEVYLAERADGAYEQRAALKRIRRGVGTPEHAVRFLRERQILARFQHPGIARLLDGGVDSSGAPYLVLEYVEGKPITAYAKDRQLSIQATLVLLLEAMKAVDAAHRALVIHRDIKPSNLLVTEKGETKLLDFGIAKILEEDADPSSTHAVHPPMTPAYAAPEQIRGGAIGTATDVYALGVLLYELLAGERPFARTATTPGELVAEIQQESFEPPSVRLRRRARGATGQERARLLRRARALAGNLDAITGQAIEWEASRRYPSVAALAEDIERHLAGLPVAARGRGRAYRLGRFVVRHRLAVAALLIVVISIVGGLLFSLRQARRALAEARRAETTQRFLVEMFETVDPSRSLGEKITARDLLDRGARQLQTQLADQPDARATLAETLARTYLGLGVFDEAAKWAAEARDLHARLDGRDALSTLNAELLLNRVLLESKPEVAETQLRRFVPRVERIAGRDSKLALSAATALADVWDVRATADRNMREIRRELYERSREIHGPESIETATALGRYSDQLAESRDLEGAEAGLRTALATSRRVAGPRSPEAIDLAGRLAHILNVAGKDAESLGLYEQLIADARLVFGEDHPIVANWLEYQASALLKQRQVDAAEHALAQAEDILRRRHHYDLGSVIRRQGDLAMFREDFALAETRFSKALEQIRTDLGSAHPAFFVTQISVASARVKQSKFDGTETLIRQVIASQEKEHGAESIIVRQSLDVLGELLRERGRPADALAVHERALAIERKVNNDAHPGAITSKREIALDLLGIGGPDNLARARREIDAAIAYHRDRPGERELLGRALWVSGRIAARAGDKMQTFRDLDEAIVILEQTLGPSAPSTLAAISDRARLGGAQSRRIVNVTSASAPIVDGQGSQSNAHNVHVRVTREKIVTAGLDDAEVALTTKAWIGDRAADRSGAIAWSIVDHADRGEFFGDRHYRTRLDPTGPENPTDRYYDRRTGRLEFMASVPLLELDRQSFRKSRHLAYIEGNAFDAPACLGEDGLGLLSIVRDDGSRLDYVIADAQKRTPKWAPDWSIRTHTSAGSAIPPELVLTYERNEPRTPGMMARAIDVHVRVPITDDGLDLEQALTPTGYRIVKLNCALNVNRR